MRAAKERLIRENNGRLLDVNYLLSYTVVNNL
jgi:hypothetical protein